MSGSVAALVERANALKAEGNAHFAAGRTAESITKYTEAVEVLQSTAQPAAESERDACLAARVAILSNLGNAYITAEDWPAAEAQCRSALNALGPNNAAASPFHAKLRHRLATALLHQGKRFEAFTHMIRVDVATLDPQLRRSITKGVGIGELDDAFSVADHPGGGLSAVARAPIKGGSTIFVEGQLVLSFDAAMPDEATATTESRCAAFARELLALRQSESRQHEFVRVQREMCGSWPRDISDVDPGVRASVDAAIAPLFTAANVKEDDEATRRIITLLALQCRYNCFHRGFFRASALVNHGCNPNAAMKYSPGRSVTLHAELPSDAEPSSIGVVALRACRDVKPGDTISVKYLGDFDFIIGVLPRREMLRSSWLFTCECDRCLADLREDAKTEWVRCTATPDCAGYLHLPAPPHYRRDAALDTCVPEAVRRRTCSACGKEQELHEGAQDAIHAVRSAGVQMMRTDNSPLKQRHEECVIARQQLLPWVHDAHWCHTTLIYVFCVRTQHRVEEVFGLFAEGKVAAAVIEFELGLRNFDAAQQARPHDEARPLDTKLDVLGWYLDLQARLRPFYPDEQLWALHVAVVRCAVALACAAPERLEEVEAIIVTRASHLNRSLAVVCTALLQKHIKATKALKNVIRALK